MHLCAREGASALACDDACTCTRARARLCACVERNARGGLRVWWRHTVGRDEAASSVMVRSNVGGSDGGGAVSGGSRVDRSGLGGTGARSDEGGTPPA